MTVAIRSLRVTADIDGRQYAAGGKQVDAANESMAASSLKAAQAMAQADRQAGQSGGVLASLSRQYLTGYKGADEFEKAVARLSRGIEKGAVPLDRVETILGGIYQKYGLTANAAALLENGQTALGNAATVLNGRLEQQEQALEGAALAHQRMANAANDNAFKQRMLMFQLNDVFQSIALGMPLTQVALQQGPQIAQIYGPGEGGIGRAFRETGQMIGGVLTKFPLVTAGVLGIGAAFAAMTYEINQTTDVAVGFGDVALASFQVLGSYIWDELQPAVDAIAPWFQTAWDGVIAGVKWVGNGIIATIKSAIEIVLSNVANIPGAFTVAGEAAANGFIRAFEWMVNKAIEGLNKLISFSNELAQNYGIGYVTDKLGWTTDGKVKPFDPFDAGKADFGGGSAAADMERRRQDTLRNIRSNYDQDYLGDYFKDVRDQAIKNAQDDDKKKGGGRGERESDYERTIRRIREQTEAAKEDTRVVDLSTYARERQSAVQDILTAAQRDGMEVGKAFANAQELINASTDKLSPALVAERQRILDVASAYAQAQADAEKAEDAQRKFKEAMEFAKETTRGFFDDFKNSLENGATVWEAFADAALNALDRVVDKLLNDVLDAIFEVNSSGGAGGESWLGSIFSGLFGGGAKADPWAGARVANAFGNVYRSQSLSAYSNRIVDNPTYFAFAKGAGVMGEAGPEAIMPLRRDATGRLGVSVSGDRYASANDNRGETIIRVALGDGLVAEILRKAEGQAVQVVQTHNEAQRNLRQNGGDF